MEEKSIVKFKKDEFAIKEYIKSILGKGKVSKVRIEYTPVGEKVIVSTNKPGLVIGKKGEKIEELTSTLKTKFKLENPRVEIDEIKQPEFDAQIVADDIALSLEKMGPIKFKVIAYRSLQRIMQAGARGAEIVLGGKLPSARAKSWRFQQGYLKKVGDSAKVVDKAQAVAYTKPGAIGVKVSIFSPYAIQKDELKVDKAMIDRIKLNSVQVDEKDAEDAEKKKTKRSKK
ncbi:30S ribosomal protein S3 [Candidatus Pacearchaeota archaeon]|jgi:small subunit ribosomal protein S3|nr:30S ribosomal protein S3 [Candidatus Pacearchaeota archaeon]